MKHNITANVVDLPVCVCSHRSSGHLHWDKVTRKWVIGACTHHDCSCQAFDEALP